MGKYGKKNEIQLDPLRFNIALLGEAGVGKTTLIKQVCEKLVGDDGYMFFDIGFESGSDAISGIVAEKIEDWAKFVEVTDDIIENKESEYPDLRVVVIDTYDELCRLADAETIRLHNKKNPDKKVESVNAAFGGYGRGMDKSIEIMLERLFELKKVGVSFIVIAHTKKKDIDDIVTEDQYSILTAGVSQKYFNAIKSKLHVLGLAYIDRDVVKERTGKKSPATGKEIVRGKIAGESRMVSFRDDTYTIDSKSRFANIIDKISLDADEFIKAINDAILAEHAKSGVSVQETEKKQSAEAKAKKDEAAKYSGSRKNNKVDPERNEELMSIIKEKLAHCSAETKEAVKSIMKSIGSKFDKDSVPTALLEEAVDLIVADTDALPFN